MKSVFNYLILLILFLCQPAMAQTSLNDDNSYASHLTNILDFDLAAAFNRFIGGNYESKSQRLNATDLDHLLHQRTVAFRGRDTWQGTFIDNHDQVRTMVRLQKLKVVDEDNRRQRMDLATVLLLTVPGVPIIYYGDEQYLAHYNDHHTIAPDDINSANNDPYNRGGMHSWDQDSSAYKIIQTLGRLRKVSPAVARGDYHTLYAGDNILVYTRNYQNDHVLVAVNRGPAKTITLKERMPVAIGQYSNLLQNSAINEINRMVVTDKNVELSLDKMSALVLRY